MADEKQKTAAQQPTDDDVTAIIGSESAGVATAMRVLEAAEQVYFGAVAATSQLEIETIGTTTSPSNLTEPR